MRYLDSYFNVKLNTSIQNMYICCTAAATQIYSNVGGNLRQQAFCCSMCTSDAIYRDSRPWKKWAHNIKVYHWTLWIVSKIWHCLFMCLNLLLLYLGYTIQCISYVNFFLFHSVDDVHFGFTGVDAILLRRCICTFGFAKFMQLIGLAWPESLIIC